MNDKLLEIKEPPKSTENETQVLGMILLDNKLIIDILDTVSYKTFFEKRNQDIWTAMAYLHYNNVNIGYETLSNRLQLKTGDDMIDYLISLNSSVPSTATFENRVDILKDTYQKRVLYDLSKDLLTKDISGIASLNLVKNIEKKIENMGINSNIINTDIHEYIDEWVNNLENLEPSEVFETGFYGLDGIVKIKRGKLILIASRPGCGKSAFATKIVMSFCKQNYHPLFISLEMGRDEFLDRVVSEMSGVLHEKFENKSELTSDDWNKIMVVRKKIKSWKFEFNDDGSMKIEQLIGLCKFLKKKNKLDILVIDYLQLLSSNEYRNQKQNQVEHISKGLKQIALSLKIPVIALSQLSRASVQGGDVREPLLSDLRSSGSLEQDADVVMMLHTKDVDSTYAKRYITLFVRKNRQGKMGRVDFVFKGDNLKFIENKKDWDKNTWDMITEKDFENNISRENDTIPDLPF